MFISQELHDLKRVQLILMYGVNLLMREPLTSQGLFRVLYVYRGA
jgi:hypothetical protein